MSDRTVVLRVVSDIHAGSVIGLCPPTGVELDDGGTYLPSAAQRWLWDCYTAAHDHCEAIMERETQRDGTVDFGFLSNGDATDGNHHGTTQIISPAEGAHIKAAVECFRVPLSLKPKWVWIVRGTEAHVGKSGGLEEGMAVAMNREGAAIQRDVNTGSWSSWYAMLDIHDRLLDFTHHGRMGQRAHTRAGYAKHYAHDIWAERMLRGERPPDLAVRSHFHTFEDSGPWHPTRPITRLIQTAAYQLKSAFAHKVVPESLSDIGDMTIVVRPDRSMDVHPCIFSPSRGETWKPSHKLAS